MRVHLIKRKTIDWFVQDHPDSKASFDYWLAILGKTDWNQPEDIKESYRTADLLGSGSYRVIFDIGGNKYRMICKYAFGDSQVHLFICWIGSHSQYDKLCKTGDQYSVNVY
jgi:mRNA interferase HigB